MTGRDNEIFIAFTNSSIAVTAEPCTGLLREARFGFDQHVHPCEVGGPLASPLTSGIECPLNPRLWGTMPPQPWAEVP